MSEKCSCEEIVAKLDEILEHIRSGLKSSGGKRKGTKRAPSAYNLFVKECLAGKKGAPGAHTEKFKACVKAWKEQKGK